jgi:membrane protease YdiL (CAAX protease family)
MIWMLLGCVVAGLYRRQLFFRNTLMHNRRSWLVEGMRGITIYVACSAMFYFIVMDFVYVLALRHVSSTSALSHLHLENKAVEATAPATALELLLWIGVSFTAGFCEEHIFRGYLLRQSIAFFRGVGTSPRFSAILSVAITCVLFGSLHLYEGIGGAVFIGLLGLVYAILALRFGNLRAVIVAHSVQDFLVGLFLFLRHLHQAR